MSRLRDFPLLAAASGFAVLFVLLLVLYENCTSSFPRRLMSSLLPANTSWTLLPAVVVFLAVTLIAVFMVSPALKRRRYGVRNALTKGTPKWAKKNEHSADEGFALGLKGWSTAVDHLFYHGGLFGYLWLFKYMSRLTPDRNLYGNNPTNTDVSAATDNLALIIKARDIAIFFPGIMDVGAFRRVDNIVNGAVVTGLITQRPEFRFHNHVLFENVQRISTDGNGTATNDPATSPPNLANQPI
jgi:hypothetical protein